MIKKSKHIRVLYPGIIFLAVSVLVIFNGYREYQQSRSELLALMKNQAKSILRTIILSSQSALLPEELIQESAESDSVQNVRIEKTTKLDLLIDQLVRPGEIVFYALQNERGIIISSANVDKLDEFNNSDFLKNSLKVRHFSSRIYNFNNREVFEAVQKFSYQGKTLGLLRIGLSLNYLNELNDNAYNRVIINSIILFASGLFLVLIFSLTLNYQVLKKQYQVVDKKLEEQLQRKERLTAMGELASGVAHEIRNPLNSISTIAQQLNKDFEPAENKEEYHKLARIVYSEVKRINETVTNFLRFAKPETLNPVKFRLSELINETVNQFAGKYNDEGVSLTSCAEADPEVTWDKNQFKQVLINLIQNARDAVEASGEIKIDIRKTDSADRNIEIKISDNGNGIPAEIKNKIFNLYFTTKASGTGIGLSIVQKIIDEHNGIISVDSDSNGTTFTILMPEKI